MHGSIPPAGTRDARRTGKRKGSPRWSWYPGLRRCSRRTPQRPNKRGKGRRVMLPEDVDPQSRCRLPLPRRDELDALGQKLYDETLDPKGGTIRGLKGPSGIQLHSPGASQYARPLNRYLRYEAGFGGRVRELAILTTARECDSQFEWAAHEKEALKEGIAPAIVDIIKHRRSTAGLAEADAVIIDFGRELFGARKVAPATFARALKQ